MVARSFINRRRNQYKNTAGGCRPLYCSRSLKQKCAQAAWPEHPPNFLAEGVTGTPSKPCAPLHLGLLFSLLSHAPFLPQKTLVPTFSIYHSHLLKVSTIRSQLITYMGPRHFKNDSYCQPLPNGIHFKLTGLGLGVDWTGWSYIAFLGWSYIALLCWRALTICSFSIA